MCVGTRQPEVDIACTFVSCREQDDLVGSAKGDSGDIDVLSMSTAHSAGT